MKSEFLALLGCLAGLIATYEYTPVKAALRRGVEPGLTAVGSIFCYLAAGFFGASAALLVTPSLAAAFTAGAAAVLTMVALTVLFGRGE